MHPWRMPQNDIGYQQKLSTLGMNPVTPPRAEPGSGV
jgi:hypothetical protein